MKTILIIKIFSYRHQSYNIEELKDYLGLIKEINLTVGLNN